MGYNMKFVTQLKGTDPFRHIVPKYFAHLTSSFSIDHALIFRVRGRKVNVVDGRKAKGAHNVRPLVLTVDC
jgi:hypothetical protein